MTAPRDDPEEVFHAFLDALEAAADPAAVAREWCEAHPHRAAEFAATAEAAERLRQACARAESTPPRDVADDLCDAFLDALETAADPAAVVREWSGAHPHRAADFAATAEVVERLRRECPMSESRSPERLGPFRIVGKIADGGMGVVFAAIQEPLGRRVAVKTIRPSRLSPPMRARFLREQQVLASLHQTHIVPIYAAGNEGDTDYFAMPYIDGVSLREVIQHLLSSPADEAPPRMAEVVGLMRSPPLPAGARDSTPMPGQGDESEPATPHASRAQAPWDLSRAYIRSVAEGMADAASAIAHAHEKNEIHRDLKPSNLMVDRDGQFWLLDFGLACHLQGDRPHATACSTEGTPLDLTVGPVGSPAYMAPEQLDGKADVCTDVWGLGVVLYELLTLRRAYALPDRPELGGRKDALDRRRQELKQPLDQPRARTRDLPRDLEAIIVKCLEIDPEQRYKTASELDDDLRRFLRGEETGARHYYPPERVARWGRRHPARAGFLALLVAAVASFWWSFTVDNANYARSFAGRVEREISSVDRAVQQAAKTLPADVRKILWRGEGFHLATTKADSNPALKFLRDAETLSDTHTAWFARHGEPRPFVNWFLLDRKGNLLGFWPTGEPHAANYLQRDYARLLRAGAAAAGPETYQSEVFCSILDGKYKFAVVAPVRDGPGGALLGLVVATVLVDSKFVALDMQQERPGARLVRRMDWSAPRPPDLAPDQQHRYVIVLARRAPGRTTDPALKPDWVEVGRHRKLAQFEEEPDRPAAIEPLTLSGSLVNYHRVGQTGFVVVVERPYPPLSLIANPAARSLVVLAVPVVGVVASVRWLVTRRRARRDRRSPGAGPIALLRHGAGNS